MANGFVLKCKDGFRPSIKGHSFLWIGELLPHPVLAQEAVEESAPVIESIIAQAMLEVSDGVIIN